MSRFLIVGLFLAAAVLALGITTVVAAHGPVASPQAGGCGTCRGTTPVCCLNCNGTFAYCARSHAFCPECPAP